MDGADNHPLTISDKTKATCNLKPITTPIINT